MEQFKSTTLVSVLGSSPAVITETLYALRNEKYFPSKLIIFTTSHGKQLFKTKKVEEKIEQLCDDYNLNKEIVNNIDFQVVERDDVALDDIRTSDDQEAMADDIALVIRNLTADPEVKIHASIAGGRKSMSFYMGYIFSMFAREFDTLSHVLVEQKYEVGDFYYPTPYSQDVKKYNFEKKIMEPTGLDAKDAVVELAEIPFIRLNSSLRKANESITLDKELTYRDCIQAYDLAQHPENIKLLLNTKEHKILVNDRELKLNDYSYAYYRIVIEKIKKNDGFFTTQNIDKIEAEWLRYIAEKIGYHIPHYDTPIDHGDAILSDTLFEAIQDHSLASKQHDRFRKEVEDALNKIHVGKTVELCTIGVVTETPIDENSPFYRKTTKRKTIKNKITKSIKTTKGGVIGLCLNPNQIEII